MKKSDTDAVSVECQIEHTQIEPEKEHVEHGQREVGVAILVTNDDHFLKVN